MIDFLPFNSDLNRFRLVVNGLATGRFKVTWGKASKTFSANELGQGINLAAEFLDNPFSEPFKEVENAVRRKQEFEAQVMGSLWHAAEPDQRAHSLEEARVLEAEARAAVKPVKHTLKIEPVP
jgi:hypothetical protein